IPLAIVAGQTAQQARRHRELRPLRLAITAIVIAGLMAAALAVPLPQRITAPVVVEPSGASYVYVTVAGRLQAALPPGTPGKRGETIAQLASQELERDRARLESETQRQQLHLAALEASRGDDPAAVAAIPAAQQSLADLRLRLGQVRELLGKL